jgi:hypothetical protein
MAFMLDAFFPGMVRGPVDCRELRWLAAICLSEVMWIHLCRLKVASAGAESRGGEVGGAVDILAKNMEIREMRERENIWFVGQRKRASC